MKTIALFGGSFDPPHIGHKAIVEALQKLEYIDKIIILPTFLNPFKSKSFASADTRLALVTEMFKEFEDVETSDFEVKQETKVASIKSVKHFLKFYKKIYLVIGADILVSLHHWQDYEELKDLVSFVVATRDNIDIPKKYITIKIDEQISSTEIRNAKKNR